MQEEIDENEEISRSERKRENKKVNKTKTVMTKRKMKREQVKESYRELVYKSDGQAYAQVTKILGDDLVGLNCFDDHHQIRIGHISGRMRSHHEIVKLGDIVLIGLREFQPDKADLLHVYTPDEAMNIDEIKSIFDVANQRIGMKGAVFDAMHRFDEANAKAGDDPFEMYEDDDEEDLEDEEEEEEIDEEKVENL